MTGTALITGASSGIGEELAWVHAEKGGDLILVARRQERLDALAEVIASEHAVTVDVIAMDLAEAGAAQALLEAVAAQGLTVDILINNAGLGAHGIFHEAALERQTHMIDLNITALTELTHLFVQGMVERGEGMILNVGSSAGFLPGPLQAVYYASKAYVNSFSQAIANELEGTGVTVTVLCPGPVATEFQDTADLEGVRGFEFAASARSVAEAGYRAMEEGRLLVIDDLRVRFLVEGVVPLLPRRPLLWLSRKTMEKSG
jgi:short-subunit dehydrogenase